MKSAMTEVLQTRCRIERGKARFPTTLGYAPLHDHKRLPGRFHARLTGADGSDLG